MLIIEMTGNYSLMLPLLVACFCAYTVADLLGDKPIYEALVERDLLRGQGDVPHLESNLLLELPVFHGAAWENKRVADLGLPVGALIVTVERGLTSLVATRDTVLEAGDRITVVISPEAAPAAALIRENTAAPHGSHRN